MLLRRLKVRSRLMVVIAVPLVLLLVVATPQVLARWDRAGAADRAADLAEAASSVADLVDVVERERVLSAALRAGGGDQVAAALANQRALTDSAVQRSATTLMALAEQVPEVSALSAAAARTLGTLGRVRAETDAARSIVPWVDPFAPIVASLLEVLDELGSVVGETGVGEELTQAGLVARAKDATSAQDAQLAAAAVWGELRGDQAGILATLRADELAYRTAYLAAVPSVVRVDRRAEIQQASVTTAGRVVDEVIAGRDVASAGGLVRWLDQSARRQVALQEVATARGAEALARAVDLGTASRQASTTYAALAGGGLLVALTVALLAARSITRPLRRLTQAADDLAEHRLPRLVDALRNPVDDDERYLAATVEAIPVRSDDELAHLARAFNAVQSVAVDVAAQQADLLRKGISDLYVNLARRNQALIERQIQLLDQLEAGEEDPDVLEHLFLLDHLATRMRRNAESLLVLAGAESGPRRSRPIAVLDVVRAALSEVEAYRRVDLGALAPATVQGLAVTDVAHLLAELLDNATSFSAPSTRVRIDGLRSGGSYQLVITDEGVGLTSEQLVELNAVLHDPPVTGLALGRSLGCLVAARLAARHGITVRLRAGNAGGVVATVGLPRALLVAETAEPAPRPFAAWATADAAVDAPPVAAAAAAPAASLAPPPARLVDALPPPAAFDAGLDALLDSDEPAVLIEANVPVSDQPDDPDGAGDLTRQPLARRVPGANGAGRGAELSEPRERRSPEAVRDALLRYRSGLRAGRTAAPGRQEGP